jgi:amidase
LNLYSNDLANDESTTNQREVSMKRAAFIILTLFVTWCPALGAKTLDLDSATIADINAAFKAGTLTAESLVQMCLARIRSYDREGPSLHAVITLNPKAIETARELDAERKAKGPRSALHGIPVVLKDNYDTADLPTTAGSVLLEGSIPRADAFLVKKLRDAGAIILAKANMSEFASTPSQSSLGGQSLNPHDLRRTPAGSSGGTGVVAVALGLMTGIDPTDAATNKSEGKFSTNYTRDLKTDALKGARIGIARDFRGNDPDVDWVVEASLDAMRKAGATIVDVRLPKWLLESKVEFYNAIRMPEFAAQIKDYLSTIGPDYPKTIEDLIDRANRFTAPREDGARPNPGRWTSFKREASSGSLENYRYTSVRDHGLPLVRAVFEGLFAAENLDAIVYPTSTRRPALLAAPSDTAPASPTASATNFANLTGFPDLIVPAGFTGDNLPVGISFFGPAFSEQKLLSLGFSFEQATRARRRPVHAPALEGESISVP